MRLLALTEDWELPARFIRNIPILSAVGRGDLLRGGWTVHAEKILGQAPWTTHSGSAVSVRTVHWLPLRATRSGGASGRVQWIEASCHRGVPSIADGPRDRELWCLAPTPAKAQRIRATTIAKLLQRHRVRRIDAETVLRMLREQAVTVAPGTTEAAVAHLEVVFAQLAVIGQQLAKAHGELDRLSASLSRPATSPEEEPQTHAQRDVAILNSLPGVGRIVLATLPAEAHDPLRRRDDQARRCLSGVAPVTKRSGKSLIVIRCLAGHNRLQDAVDHGAAVAVQRNPVSKAKYAALRARGHARALRSVGDRLPGVACAMLESQTLFDPACASQARAA